MAEQKPFPPNNTQIQNAESLWENFTRISKWTVIATCVILVILALAFIDW